MNRLASEYTVSLELSVSGKLYCHSGNYSPSLQRLFDCHSASTCGCRVCVEQDTWRVLPCPPPPLHKVSSRQRGIKVPQLRNVPLHILRSRFVLCTVSFLKKGVAIIAVKQSLYSLPVITSFCVVFQSESVAV